MRFNSHDWPTIGAAIVTVIALFTSTQAAIVTLAYYIFYQQIENYLVSRVFRPTQPICRLLVFASVVIGVSFGGLLGGLVAIPVAGCIRVLVLEYLRSKDPD